MNIFSNNEPSLYFWSKFLYQNNYSFCMLLGAFSLKWRPHFFGNRLIY